MRIRRGRSGLTAVQGQRGCYSLGCTSLCGHAAKGPLSREHAHAAQALSSSYLEVLCVALLHIPPAFPARSRPSRGRSQQWSPPSPSRPSDTHTDTHTHIHTRVAWYAEADTVESAAGRELRSTPGPSTKGRTLSPSSAAACSPAHAHVNLSSRHRVIAGCIAQKDHLELGVELAEDAAHGCDGLANLQGRPVKGVERRRPRGTAGGPGHCRARQPAHRPASPAATAGWAVTPCAVWRRGHGSRLLCAP
jgi:hypothetical protein